MGYSSPASPESPAGPVSPEVPQTSAAGLLDETELVTGADQLLSTAVSNGLSDPFDPAQGGWVASSLTIDPSTGIVTGNGGIDPFAGGPAVDQYAGTPAQNGSPNPITGGQNIDPVSGVQNADTFSSAANTASDIPAGAKYVPANTLQGLNQIDTVTIGSTSYAHFQVTIDGTTYDAYLNDAVMPGQAMLVPAASSPAALGATPSPVPVSSPAAGPAQLPPASVSPSAQPPGSPSPSPGPVTPSLTSAPGSPSGPPPPQSVPLSSGSWTTWFGDLLATVAGLFSPSAVGPYLQPQTPAGLPIGLQQMGQLNARGAQAALHFNAKATQVGALGIGASASLGVGGALAGSAVAEGLYGASLRAAVTFPRATSARTQTIVGHGHDPCGEASGPNAVHGSAASRRCRRARKSVPAAAARWS
jgi:hypothetical protein